MADQGDARLPLLVSNRMEERMAGDGDAFELKDDKESPTTDEEDGETDDETTGNSTEEDGGTDDDTTDNSTDKDEETDDEMNTPRKIEWSITDRELERARKERIENSQKPSMWEYNSEGGVPTEFANLDLSTFLTNPVERSVCFLPRDILVRICSMLSACDFVDLSLTCRFIHWRMFTFCTCYTPYSVELGLKMNRICLKTTGLSTLRPFGLRKPFFFEALYLYLFLPKFNMWHYDKCLPFILDVRGLVRHLYVYFIYWDSPKDYFFNFSDTNEFLKIIDPGYYEHSLYVCNDNTAKKTLTKNNVDIYENCPHARQMYRVSVSATNRQDRLNVPVFQNSFGNYSNPLDSAVIATLKLFLTSSINLIFHRYAYIEEHNGKYPLIEHLFQEFGEFEEFLCTKRGSSHDCHIWTKVVATKNGGQVRIMIELEEYQYANVIVGKNETFEEMCAENMVRSLYSKDSIVWEMETAVEPDEIESRDVELDEAVESDEAEKLDEAVESKNVEELDEVEESDETEEEQGEYVVCFCSIL